MSTVFFNKVIDPGVCQPWPWLEPLLKGVFHCVYWKKNCQNFFRKKILLEEIVQRQQKHAHG